MQGLNTVLTWNGTSTSSTNYLWPDDAGAGTDATSIPVMGNWLSADGARVVKWQQMYSVTGLATDHGCFSDNRRAESYARETGQFIQALQEQMIENWIINTTAEVSGTTFNVDIPPQVRRHGGIYNVRNRKRHSLHRPQANEERARRLLQRLIGFRRYARYIRDGFISHRGASGRVYQIFPGDIHMRVWFKGQRVENLCLCIEDHSLPPTDSVVMRLLMLEHSEAEFREQANISRAATKTDQQIIDESIASIRAMTGQVRALAG
jgi:hypothetical protein